MDLQSWRATPEDVVALGFVVHAPLVDFSVVGESRHRRVELVHVRLFASVDVFLVSCVLGDV